MAWITTDGGVALPYPEIGSGGVSIATMFEGDRNSNGMVRGQVVGDDKLSLDLNLFDLPPQVVQNILRIWDRDRGGEFFNKWRVLDPRVNDFVYLEMYVSDRTLTPGLVDRNTDKPLFWKEMSFSLVER